MVKNERKKQKSLLRSNKRGAPSKYLRAGVSHPVRLTLFIFFRHRGVGGKNRLS